MVTATGSALGSEMTTSVEPIDDRSTAGVLHVAAIFASHMVLQRNKPIAVFGALNADCAGLEVSAEIRDFDGSVIVQAHAYASKEIKNGFSPWRVMLPAQPEGGPYTLRVTAGNDFIEYYDVLIGEVWLAGGQSNMELELRNSENAEEALESCADPLLRFYNVPKTGVINRNAEHAASWQESSPENSGVMSAVAYYFARKLRDELDSDLPIGIIDCYIGGTSISCWMSEDALNSSESGRAYLARYEQAVAGKTQGQFDLEYSEWQSRSDTWNASIAAAREADPDVTWDTLTQQYGECPWPPPMTPTSQWRPTGPFHAMLERIVPYSLAGFLWYQGEANRGFDGYARYMQELASLWRGRWGDAEMPFYFVQLAPYTYDDAEGLSLPLTVEQQTQALDLIPFSGMASTTDAGSEHTIHPPYKIRVGERLALLALKRTYGYGALIAQSPRYESVRFEAGRAIVRFRTDGIMGPQWKGPIEGFEIAGADRVFVPAEAEYVPGAPEVTVHSDRVPEPVAVRYAFRNMPRAATLVNSGDLPAYPFRTDDWNDVR